MSFQLLAKTPTGPNIFEGYPSFGKVNITECPSGFKTLRVSPCGRFLALSTDAGVTVYKGEEFQTILLELDIKDVYDLEFSPGGSYLSTWQRPHIDNESYQNVKIWYLNQDEPSAEEPMYEYQAKTQNSWSLQFSKLDNFAIRRFGKELRIIKLSHPATHFDFDAPFATLVPDGQISTYMISPAEHPTICTFSPEKGGKPAQLTIYPIIEGNIQKKIATKTFFKADSCQLKWNELGNAVLCLAITDFDASNQSYYGENTLYLLSFQGVNGALGGESVRVSLGKEGPIHDFTWSPTSRQFGVIYGFMPAKITFFDLKGNAVHTLTEQRKNTMIYSPSGRYILIAGFGNLQGAVEILDRHERFKCIAKFDAANTSICKWSPGGEFILTATTSPRLRVDNGMKVWHISGKLCFVSEYTELLEASWRNICPFKCKNPDSHVISAWDSTKVIDSPALKDPVLSSSQLEVHSSVAEYSSKSKRMNNNSSSSKPVGAYRPPHARRAAATGVSVPGASPKNTVPGMSMKPAKGVVPGMAPKESKSAAKNRKKRENSKKTNGVDSEGSTNGRSNGNSPEPSDSKVNKETSPEEKKIRSLLKKLRAIETLKQRQAVGDKLEDTQILKIQTEEKVLQELEALGWKP
ncbi:HFL036Cp [Eremothecium sinecaudum]|uniref:Eukaryotic translation initiation factor 2A n=1 Tax=Eremothecium sinecaudum TaxID=45286 RepID=A0A0X8HUP7_9SACH|nr:HFL036Cp [Eremothecium sinecaudum]AMD21820.1 HFL036Cp [Eremothecium sinecaudum]